MSKLNVFQSSLFQWLIAGVAFHRFHASPTDVIAQFILMVHPEQPFTFPVLAATRKSFSSEAFALCVEHSYALWVIRCPDNFEMVHHGHEQRPQNWWRQPLQGTYLPSWFPDPSKWSTVFQYDIIIPALFIIFASCSGSNASDLSGTFYFNVDNLTAATFVNSSRGVVKLKS